VDNETIIGGIFIRKGHTLDTITQSISNEPGLALTEEKATYQRLTR
jgi:hypothetical protein